PYYISSHRTWQSGAILFVGLLLTGLFAGVVFLILGRIERTRQYAEEILRSKEGLEKEIQGRRKAERSLRESEVKYRGLVETSQDLIWQCDLEGRLIFLNKAWENTYGYPVDAMIGNCFSDFQSPEIAKRDIDEFSNMIKGGTMVGYETIHTDRSGNDIHLVFNAMPRHDPEGTIIGAQGTAFDITYRKKIEEELLKIQKLESLGVLAGGIAHDFNNLMTGILGNISLAKMHADPEEKVYERLRNAEGAMVRAQDLTRQLLTFSRGGTPIKETASVPEIIRESCEFVLRGSSVKCVFSIADDIKPVEVDVGQIAQVINNLIINAKQAMASGGIINVGCENFEVEEGDALPLKNGEYVQITIEDHGDGIPEEHLSKIFDPYFTTKEGGSGLGLATTFSIVKKHEGHTAVSSRAGVGTTFQLYLPVSEIGLCDKSGKYEELITGDGKILVMDDEVTVREVAGAMLNELGYKVDFAENGREALELYSKALDTDEPFSMLIMDLTIPGGMGGKETIQKLKEIDQDVKAIVSSGYSNDLTMADYKQYGFKGVIEKPYRIEKFSEIVSRTLRGTS
ncbi:MAG: ATP-binding protein, partial [Thermodesulfovibrionales bacterium]